MDIKEARSILARKEAGDRSVTLHEHSAASVFLGSYYSFERPDLLRPADGSPPDTSKQWAELTEGTRKMAEFARRGSDLHVHVAVPSHDQAPRYGTSGASNLPDVDPRNARSGVFGAQENEADRIGGRVVARLPRTASSYELVDSPDGDGCIVLMVGNPDNVIDPGAISNGTEPRMRGSGVPSSVGDARYQQKRHHALSLLVRAAGGKVA